MKVLLDTCVLSEARKPDGSPNVKAFLESIPEENLYVSVLTLGEITKGIERLPDGRKKVSLQHWADKLQTVFRDRLIGVDQATAEIWGRLTARAEQEGHTIPAVDGLLASTALRHDFKIATRNSKHFRATRAGLVDPWMAERETV